MSEKDSSEEDTIRLSYEGSAERLDKVLTELHLDNGFDEPASRTALARMIKEGGVKVDDQLVTRPAYKVEPGQVVCFSPWKPQPIELLPYDFPLEIVYSDDSLIVINKPAGLTVHPGAGNRDKTLVNALVANPDFNYQPSGSIRPGIVHRLDKDTSGLLVVARTHRAHVHLSQQFAERSIRRSYVALAISTPRKRRPIDCEDSGVFDYPIGRDPGNRTRMAVDGVSARTARSHWVVLERFPNAVLLEIKLETGRTHQIRVHLAQSGSPLVGDPVYGAPAVLPSDLQRKAKEFGRQALHAKELGFAHPVTSEYLHFEAPLPREMAALISVFRQGSV